VISLRAPIERERTAPPDERAQALSPVISFRAPINEGAQASTPELSLRAVDQDMSSWMAGTTSIKLIRMTGGSEEISTLGSGSPLVNTLETGTLEISAQAHGAPTTQGRNTMEAADTNAPRQKIRLFPKETRPFNYARLKEDEAPHLHIASNEHTGDNANEEASFETEHYAPSSDGSDLGDQMDLLLNGGTRLSRGRCDNNNDSYENGSTLVDYNGDESEDDRTRSDDDFKVDMAEDENCLAQEDEVGDEQSATHDTGDKSSFQKGNLHQSNPRPVSNPPRQR
jgi:hypothetical protein